MCPENRYSDEVFLDPNKLIREDEEHPEELRYDILGRVGKILFVVCAFRDRNVIRMISARRNGGTTLFVPFFASGPLAWYTVLGDEHAENR